MTKDDENDLKLTVGCLSTLVILFVLPTLAWLAVIIGSELVQSSLCVEHRASQETCARWAGASTFVNRERYEP